MTRAAQDFLRQSGKDPSLISPQKIFMWASVHRGGSAHLAHVHKKSVVSGVYFVTSEESAGDLLFHDPRGSLPPFENHLAVKPTPGQLVLFPGWLVHQVRPTLGAADRVSISFNAELLESGWDVLADLSVRF